MLPVNATSTSFGYQPGLDGLRGVFVLAVLVFHGGFGWASGGFLGVSAFFTLSGFLICALLVDERARSGTVDLGRFWARRARRLLPAAWLGIGAAVVYGATIAGPAVQRDLQGDVLAALAFVANWRFISSGAGYGDLFGEPSPVTHLWSLAVEEQYYLVFPVLVIGLLALGRGRHVVLAVGLAVAGVASIAAMVTLFDQAADTSRLYYGTDTRAAEFLVGALAALVWRRWRLTIPARPAGHAGRVLLQVGAVLAGLGLLFAWSQAEVNSPMLYRGGFAVHAVLVALVVLAATQPGPVRSVVAYEPLRRLGELSYGIYVYHWPIFLWLSPDRTGIEGWPLFAARVAVTLAVAVASFVLVERPVRRGDLLRGKVAVAALPLSLVLMVGAVMVVPTPPPSTLDGAIGDEVDLSDSLRPGRGVGTGPDQVDVPAVSVFGDSTAIGVFRGLLAQERAEGLLAVRRGHIRLGCGLVRVDALRTNGETFDVAERCDRMHANWSRVLGSARPDVAVVLFGPWDVSDHVLDGRSEWSSIGQPDDDERARAELREASDLLARRVPLVIWLTSPPMGGDHGDHPDHRERMERWNQLVVEAARDHPSGRVFSMDLAGWFDGLPGGAFDTAIRPDGVHIADDHAAVVGAWLSGEILDVWEARSSP